MAIKETIPFNFDDIYANIAARFETKGYDIEEGSNTMQLVTAMSYLTSMLNANTAVNINETLLTEVRKRDMALLDARVMGYEIDHIQSYQYTLTVSFTDTTGSEVTETIPKYSSFTSGDYTYYYMGDAVDVVVPASGTNTVDIVVKEGTLYKFADEATLTEVIESIYDDVAEEFYTQYFVDVPFTDIENEGIELFLTYYDDEGGLHEEKWTKSPQFMVDQDTVLNKEFVRLDSIEFKTPRLYFKLGDVGQELRVGSILEMNVIESSGADGAMDVSFTPVELTDATVTAYELAVQGTDEETMASIKQNAPLFNNTANRIITKPDYLAFCERQTTVKYADIWDGQDEFPHVPGNIWFSFVPDNLTRSIIDPTILAAEDYNDGVLFELQNPYDATNWYIEDAEITNNVDGVWDVLDTYKVPTLEFNHRHPIYMDFDYTVKIARYSVKTSEAAVNFRAFTVINDYFEHDVTIDDEDQAERFGFEYFQSNLIKRIDQELADIMGFDLTLTTEIYLSDKNIVKEILYTGEADYYREVRFHLGVPFEGIFNASGIPIYANLPDITTLLNFGSGNYALSVNEFSLVTDTVTYTGIDINTFDITHNSDVVGKMHLYDGPFEDIEVVLYVEKDGTFGHEAGASIPEAPFNTGFVIDVAYPSSNIKMTRNTIPRLKSVSFT
jgi:hypothetical protein